MLSPQHCARYTGGHSRRSRDDPFKVSWRDEAVLALVFADTGGSMGPFSCFQQAESKSGVVDVNHHGVVCPPGCEHLGGLGP